MPQVPNAHAAATMVLTAFAFFLFTRQRIPLETSSLAVLVVLAAGFQIFPLETPEGTLDPISFFSGFGHEALVAVCALMIIGQGLVTTGALVPLGRGIARMWKTGPRLSMLLTLLLGAVCSAFVNNTPIVVLLIPILVSVAQRNKTSPAPWLLPMNYSTLLGGTGTTIGTSTNLLVVGVAADLGLRRFDMFDFVWPAILAGSLGLVYLWLIAPRFFAGRESPLQAEYPRIFVSQLEFPEESDSIGKTLSELKKKTHGEVQIVKLRRAAENYARAGTSPLPDARIDVGDRITVRGTAEQIKELEDVLQATVLGKQSDEKDDGDEEELQLAQIVPLETSPLVNRTLAETYFADRYQVAVIAIHRAAADIRRLPDGVGRVLLKAGDVLLVQGPRERIDELKAIGSLLVLDERVDLPASRRGRLAILILVAVVATAAAGILPIATSATCGALLMLLTRCMNWRDVQSALSVPVILIVVVSLALGSALQQTGATLYVAELFLFAMTDAAPATILAGLIFLMAILTNVVSNNAAAVIGTPIAISIANQLGIAPEPFVLAVLFGANLSFATPMAYKTNVLVMSAGSYSFADFVRVGLPLTILLWATYSWLLPTLYDI